ncbi:unnamed protein product [Clonostachys rosea f. rosea IK726]|uniref:Uncharacterized protein n=1 Tax=Clonostachys rosea f. rosea IK726 TaxID=1349383 RepID=A0ACA9TG55_BIOOC|nr:unnamed protein product [Clonostachys rosea f. rosea IK726]
MSEILLFCTAQEAKPLAAKISKYVKTTEGYDNALAIVKFRDDVSADEKFETPDANGSFETQWIGASVGDVRAWVLDHQEKLRENEAVDANLVAILDDRSASDETIQMDYYQDRPGLPFRESGLHPEEGGPPYTEDEILPRKSDAWYSFRIRYQHFHQLVADLTGVTSAEVVFPYYFRQKDEFVNEQGVFDLDKVFDAL